MPGYGDAVQVQPAREAPGVVRRVQFRQAFERQAHIVRQDVRHPVLVGAGLGRVVCIQPPVDRLQETARGEDVPPHVRMAERDRDEPVAGELLKQRGVPVPGHVAAGREDHDRIARFRGRLVYPGREKRVTPDAGVCREVVGDPPWDRVRARFEGAPHRLERGNVRSVRRVRCGGGRVPELGDELPAVAGILCCGLAALQVDPMEGDRSDEVRTGGLGERDRRVRPRHEVRESRPCDGRLRARG